MTQRLTHKLRKNELVRALPVRCAECEERILLMGAALECGDFPAWRKIERAHYNHLREKHGKRWGMYQPELVQVAEYEGAK